MAMASLKSFPSSKHFILGLISPSLTVRQPGPTSLPPIWMNAPVRIGQERSSSQKTAGT